MRFIDTNIFLYALIRPKRDLSRNEQIIKNKSKKILESIDINEKVMTTVVHISEVINILESNSTYEYALESANSILLHDNILILSVSKNDYAICIGIAKKYNIGINDALAVFFMQNHQIKEIYSFDKHFDKIDGIKKTVG